MRRAGAVAALVATVGACHADRARTAAGPDAGPAGSSAPAREPSRRATDPLWLAARDADPAERARLASAEGAAGLLEGVADGGETARVALAALPDADDAEIALGRLGELARVPGELPRAAILDSIVGIGGRPPRPREALDPDGARRCAILLLELARNASVPREDRAAAVGALRALAERGYVDRGRIPRDLDP